MKDSIFRSAIRSFFIAFFAMVGIAIGFIPLMLIFAALISQTDDDLEVKSHYSSTILANAQDKRKVISKSAPVILKVNVGGFIGTEKLNMHTIREQLTESREGELKSDRVKAVLVHINSPGGTVVDADGIYRAIKYYKEKHKVPVYAYIDGMCASGGMYIASACDKIYASDISLIGSVGVISPSFFNVTELMGKIGIESKTLFAGKGKDNLNPFRPWKPGEEDNLKSLIDYYYNHFVDVVSTSRPDVSRARLVNEYGAHVFPAEKAMELGFIDGTGYSLNEAITMLTKNIGIEDDYYQVVKMERKVSLSDLFKRDSPMMTGTVSHKLELSPEFDPRLMNQFLYLYLPSE